MIRILISAATALALLTLASCGRQGRSPLPGSSKGRNFNKEAIQRNIDALETAPWHASTYTEILDNQIGASSQLSDRDKEALTINLNKNYTDQVIRCTDSIMENACASNHALIKDMMASLAQVEPKLQTDYRAADRAALKNRVAIHDNMLSFSVSSSYKKPWDRPYDIAYDRLKRSQASSYRTRNPKCTAIQAKIKQSAVDATLKKRRANYDALVASHK